MSDIFEGDNHQCQYDTERNLTETKMSGRRLDHVQLRVPSFRGTAALVTHAVDLQPVAPLTEPVGSRHLVHHLGDLLCRKFDQFSTLVADQVIVLRVTIIVLEDVPAIGPCHLCLLYTSPSPRD